MEELYPDRSWESRERVDLGRDLSCSETGGGGGAWRALLSSREAMEDCTAVVWRCLRECL